MGTHGQEDRVWEAEATISFSFRREDPGIHQNHGRRQGDPDCDDGSRVDAFHLRGTVRLVSYFASDYSRTSALCDPESYAMLHSLMRGEIGQADRETGGVAATGRGRGLGQREL